MVGLVSVPVAAKRAARPQNDCVRFSRHRPTGRVAEQRWSVPRRAARGSEAWALLLERVFHVLAGLLEVALRLVGLVLAPERLSLPVTLPTVSLVLPFAPKD